MNAVSGETGADYVKPGRTVSPVFFPEDNGDIVVNVAFVGILSSRYQSFSPGTG